MNIDWDWQNEREKKEGDSAHRHEIEMLSKTCFFIGGRDGTSFDDGPSCWHQCWIIKPRVFRFPIIGWTCWWTITIETNRIKEEVKEVLEQNLIEIDWLDLIYSLSIIDVTFVVQRKNRSKLMWLQGKVERRRRRRRRKGRCSSIFHCALSHRYLEGLDNSVREGELLMRNAWCAYGIKD